MKNIYISSTVLCLCPHCLTIKLNFNISKKAYLQPSASKVCELFLVCGGVGGMKLMIRVGFEVRKIEGCAGSANSQEKIY